MVLIKFPTIKIFLERSEKMRQLFICHTYYHVLISSIKALKSKKNDSDIMLSFTLNTNLLPNDKKILEKLEKSKIFKNVILDNNFSEILSKNINLKNMSKLEKLLYYRKYTKNILCNLNEYDEINIFNDRSPMGIALSSKHIYYNLLEDGTDCFINNKSLINNPVSIKKIIKRVFNVYGMGESKYVKSIEVNNKNGIFIKNKNIIENSKKELLKSLTKKEQKTIIEIFIENSKIKLLNNRTLIITQPLSEDGILESEKKKIKIYKRIINEYCNGELVAIKVHPRETTDYSNICKDIVVVDEMFPLEIINYLDDIKLNKIITISSTSINLIENSKEKIYLGWNYIKE